MDFPQIDLGSQAGRTPAADAAARLQALLAQIGAEVAGPLTSAMERITTLADTGTIDRESLRALRDEVEAARQAGMIGQQLTRFAAGRMKQSHELLQLADVVGHVLAHRQRQTEARGASLCPQLKPVEVLADASLLFSLLNATVDWALAHAASPIEFSIEAPDASVAPKLGCRFSLRPSDEAGDAPAPGTPPSLDTLTWRLIEQTAWTIGLGIERRLDEATLSVVFAFPPRPEPEPASANEGFAASANSQPLAGSHVLVIASRREMRVRIRDALRDMSLIVDFVNSVDAAAAFCREGLPHAVIVEGIQAGERFARFRADIVREVPGFVFVEIVEEGRVVQMSGVGGAEVARVGREAVAESLPATLMFELSKGL